jgi:hypothetical protein
MSTDSSALNPKPIQLTCASFGDSIEVRSVDGQLEVFFVMHACTKLDRGYFCASHGVHAANLGNLMMHLESGGAHHVAIWCRTHRIYEAPTDAMVDVVNERAVAGWAELWSNVAMDTNGSTTDTRDGNDCGAD